MRVKIIALDLERTLISDAMSVQPRPGLFGFLSFCHQRFDRVALFTTVEEADARKVLEELDLDGYLPPGLLARLEYVNWGGVHKDLAFIPNAVRDEALLIDDDAGWIRPDQRGRWVAIAAWDGGADSELLRVRSVLERWLDPGASPTPDR